MNELKLKAHIYIPMPEGMSEEQAEEKFYKTMEASGISYQIYEKEVQEAE